MAEHTTPTQPQVESSEGVPPDPDEGGLDRRRLVLGGVALAGTTAATTLGTAGPAAAGHNTDIAYDSQSVVHVDVTNTTAGSTRISSNISGTAAFVALNNYPVGISRPDGMLGRTAYTTSNCAGVAGTCESATGGIGVMGAAKAADGTGVYAYSGSVVPSTVAPAGTGLYASGGPLGLVAVARDPGGVAGRFDGRAQAESVTLTRTAGRKVLGKARGSITIKDVPSTDTSIVLATIQHKVAGVYVAAAVADPVASVVRVYFNKKAPKGTVVGWLVVN